MKADDVIEHFGRGSVAETARRLEVSRETLYRWRKRGMKVRTQEWVEHRSGGALRADRGDGKPGA